MDLLVPWLLAPVLFGALTLGTGLLVERAGGFRMPVPLLFGVGFCGMVCASQALVRLLAPATPWVLLVLAAAGLALGRERLREIDRPAVALVLAVFAVYAAPTVLTGHVTFLGYGNQGDGGFHLVLVDQLLSHGYDVGGLARSSYSETLRQYFDTAYPTGSHTVLGSWRALTGQDAAWLLQPYLASLVALSALGLYGLIPARSRWAAAAAAGLAASGGLLYAYANNQQALKELAALLVIITAVGSVPALLSAPASWRSSLPAAVIVAGGLGVLSLAMAPWLGPLLLVAAAGLWLRHRRRALGVVAGFALLSVLFALPALTRAADFVKVTNVSLTGAQEFGNLIGALPFVQAFGVWPADDFRYPLPAGVDAAWLLVGAVALAALLGFLAALRRGAWPLVLFAVVSVIGFLAVAGRASPWAYAKALVLLSPVALVLAGYAAVALWDERRRAEAVALLAVLGLGVGWTAARGYHSASPAPHDRLSELAGIGERYAGEGPLLYLDADEFGKHFLRRTQPTGIGEVYRPESLRFAEGRDLGFGSSGEPDDLDPASVLDTFKLIVVRYGPETSRPSSGWERAFHGDFYDVWARASEPRILAHQRFATSISAAAPAPCDELRTLVADAPGGARLAFAPRAEAVGMVPGTRPHPEGWKLLTGSPEGLIQIGPGTVGGPVSLESGRYDVWMRGSVERAVTIRVDGRDAGRIFDALSPRRSPMHAGTVTLDGGTHDVELVVGGGSLAPGDGGINRVVGPVLFTPAGDPTNVPVQTIAVDRWRSLCGRSLDWAEVLA